MGSANMTSRTLGVAFLVQYVTSVSSGFLLQPALIVPGNTKESMIKIADNPSLMKANMLVDVLTALGIIFLGAMLFLTLRDKSEKVALVAFGFYILEAMLLAASRLDAFSLLRISQQYAAAGQPVYLQTMAGIALESIDFAFALHMLAFCLGAILFYYLLYTSRVVPPALSLWGLVTVVPLLIATLFGMFDYRVPDWVVLPYVPFEFVIGVWILVKGIRSNSAAAGYRQALPVGGQS
jgi:hypothetical protein